MKRRDLLKLGAFSALTFNLQSALGFLPKKVHPFYPLIFEKGTLTGIITQPFTPGSTFLLNQLLVREQSFPKINKLFISETLGTFPNQYSLLAIKTGIPFYNISRNRLSPSETEIVNEARRKLHASNITFTEFSSDAEEDLEAMLQDFQKEDRPIDEIYIEFLDIIPMPENIISIKDQSEQNTIAKYLRYLAKKYNISIITVIPAFKSQNPDGHLFYPMNLKEAHEIINSFPFDNLYTLSYDDLESTKEIQTLTLQRLNESGLEKQRLYKKSKTRKISTHFK